MGTLISFSKVEKAVRDLIGDELVEFQTTLPRIREKFTWSELNDHVLIDSDGIFLEKNGHKIKGFLYIEKGYDPDFARRRGIDTIVPKFHIVNCKTIDEQKRRRNFHGHYVFANYPITMTDLDGEEKDLFLCKNCISMVNDINFPITTQEYAENFIFNVDTAGTLTLNDLPLGLEREFHNYSENWEEISKNVRELKNYTCEECGITLKNRHGERFYMETHHIDGNKANNKPFNLQVLCILCHAFADKRHILNYTTGNNYLKLYRFITEFHSRLQEINHPYLENGKQFLGIKDL
ncbi:MAG: hypothetical protein Kow00108_22860 [Calditrichia bacterium]